MLRYLRRLKGVGSLLSSSSSSAARSWAGLVSIPANRTANSSDQRNSERQGMVMSFCRSTRERVDTQDFMGLGSSNQHLQKPRHDLPEITGERLDDCKKNADLPFPCFRPSRIFDT